MQAVSDIDAARHEGIASSGAGFPFLFAFGLAWLGAAVLSYFVPPDTAAWIYLLQGVVAIPLAFAIQKGMRYPRASGPNPLLPLALQLLFIQPVAFPVFLLVLSFSPEYVPVALAVVVAAHFLPYQWLHKTNLYIVLAVVISAGAYALGVLFGQAALHYTGFFVSACLLVGSRFAHLHARPYVRALSGVHEGAG